MAIKFDRMVTYRNEFLPKKSHDTSIITWVGEIPWKTKTIKFPLPQAYGYQTL